MPACDHTGTPRHFHSSTTSASACLIRLRTRASVLPVQYVRFSILASIIREALAAPVGSRFCFFVAVAFFMVVLVGRLQAIACTRRLLTIVRPASGSLASPNRRAELRRSG